MTAMEPNPPVKPTLQPEPPQARTSIKSLYERAVVTFSRLISSFKEADTQLSQELTFSAFEDELGYFRLWAGNSGAHRKGRISLDHKLRYSSQVHDRVTQYLRELNQTLQDAITIIQNGGDYSFSESSSEFSDDEIDMTEEDLPTTTSLQYRYKEIALRIKSLMRLLVILRQPTPRDRTERCATIPMAHFQKFDISHVSNKFPIAPQFLIERLGRANTKRRQLFKYLEGHHEKVALYIDAPIQDTTTQDQKNDEEPDEENSQDCSQTITLTMNTQTTVTTVRETSQPMENIDLEEVDCMSEGGGTETSYAPSVGGSEDYILVPPPPKSAEPLGDRPFSCSFCYYMINPSTTRSWERHVFKDLKPYVCTFEDCKTPTQLFETRRQWYHHEAQIHRREWCCAQCNIVFPTRDEFKNHLDTKHAEQSSESIVNQCERAIMTDQQCPICKKVCSTARLLGHLGRHMQQVSLFVLPNDIEEKEQDSEVDAEEHEEDSETESEAGSDEEAKSNSAVVTEDSGKSLDTEPHLSCLHRVRKELAEIQVMNSSGQPFIPQTKLDELLSMDVVVEMMEEISKLHPEPEQHSRHQQFNVVIKESHKFIHQDYKKVLALLVMAEQELCIVDFFEKQKKDENLPFDKNVLENLDPELTKTTFFNNQQLFLTETLTSKNIENLNIDLYDAAENGVIEVVRELLDRGADVNAQGGKFGNALQAAARNETLEIVRLLLDHGADVNAQGGHFGTALQAAAYSATLEKARFLLDHGADVNAQGGHFGTALQAAAYSATLEKARFLLDHGADVNAQGGQFGTALQAAAFSGTLENVRLLLDHGADVNAQGGHFGTALQAAAFSGTLENVRLLLDHGADVNAQGGKFGTAFQAAAFSGTLENIRLLLDHGADVNAQGGKFGNALQAAALSGILENVRLLLDHGADVNAQGGQYGTALQAAAYGATVENVRLLLDHGADVNAQGGQYGTALQAAAYGATLENVRLLLDHGADVNARSKYGSVIEVVGESAGYSVSKEKIIKLLRDHGAT